MLIELAVTTSWSWVYNSHFVLLSALDDAFNTLELLNLNAPWTCFWIPMPLRENEIIIMLELQFFRQSMNSSENFTIFQ